MSDRLPVSAFIICRNEAKTLENCLLSLSQCSEIIIVDSGSTDETETLAQRFQKEGWPIRFIHEKWRGFAGQKQFAMDQCSQPWVLNLDADERLDANFQQVFPELLKASPGIVGWRIPRRNFLIGHGYPSEGITERPFLRLIRSGAGKYDLSQTVHEGIIPNGSVRVVPQGSLLHYRPLPIEELLLKLNSYSSLKADQLFAEGETPRYARLLLNPIFYFCRLYFRRRLIQCGIPGFIEAAMNAIYSFLTEAKLFQRHALRKSPPRDTRNGDARTHDKTSL
jgi:glycosyltransferase involved in cell wall biosynthesis